MFCKRDIYWFVFIIVLFFDATTIAVAQPGKIVKWVVEKNSSLRVQGTSNLNSFTCNINEYSRKDTIICFGNATGPINLRGEIQMDILGFNCHSNMITTGLRKTLKADEYPTMTIRFLSIQYMPVFQNKMELIKGWIEVKLAGSVKRFELSYSFLQAGLSYVQLNGMRRFRFSDFNLSPPQKFGGLIKIKDDFDVHFQLILRTI